MNSIQLIWDIHYQGPHSNIFMKKLERQLDLKTELLWRERYVLNGKQLERAVCRLDLGDYQWDAAVLRALQLARQISPGWKLVITDAERQISGRLPSAQDDPLAVQYAIQSPSGLDSFSWTLTRDTEALPVRMTGKDMW